MSSPRLWSTLLCRLLLFCCFLSIQQNPSPSPNHSLPFSSPAFFSLTLIDPTTLARPLNSPSLTPETHITKIYNQFYHFLTTNFRKAYSLTLPHCANYLDEFLLLFLPSRILIAQRSATLKHPQPNPTTHRTAHTHRHPTSLLCPTTFCNLQQLF
ncbi:hypothetical protein F4815DRAFT_381344 [Daldinia loculata]|nr:hypothetical protein F4815DRAFT_381344 [Daldinia loculata]